MHGQSVRVEGFRTGELGIELGPPREQASDRSSTTDARMPDHPDHALYLQAEEAVTRIDSAMGRTRDGSSERIMAAGVLMAKQRGMDRIDHMVLSMETTSLPAGHNVFVVQGSLADPGHLRTVPEEAYAQAGALERFAAEQARAASSAIEERQLGAASVG